ncbi:antiviral reverse transcriptase Drt3b [Chitinophaga barathri]|uniref:RNA-directed DNA polymerase n=1 Tax=Chitinophaga barathri TaxID=1647451 RepID=A0A3N4MZA5_9BACT|nr:antiviral reverse transcriptase Drt3b [Chitinophaga barathri]RPD40703.1 RNA-directed DNA polymerase [Chitinophaga barathri]
MKKKYIKYKKERVVFSDVLPFEIPVTFSNRHFYNFLTRYKIEIKDGKLTWLNHSPSLPLIIPLIFGIEKDKCQNIGNGYVDDTKSMTIPFNFKISHKENDFRALTLIHPINQISVVEFYEKYKEAILYYCNQSEFSIRKAHKVAKYRYYKDRTHYTTLAQDQEFESFEEYNKEYEHLKTFFVYKNYGNIHKFYESYKYHRCEKKYNRLFKFDISRCFDSIYTHSISWALFNKEYIKLRIGYSHKTFPGEFDSLMQRMNHNETNGIVIGPEFSRIFAELILQKIDTEVAKSLKNKEKIYNKRDYEIFRYVDDYFVFYNEESTKERIIKSFRLNLKDFKLSLNDSKNIHYEKPIITEITIAKQRLTELIQKQLIFEISTQKKEISTLEINGVEKIGTENDEIKGSIYVSSNTLITKIKTVIKETGVEYKDVLNYTLALIDRRSAKILKDYKRVDKAPGSEKNIVRSILEILDVTFFLYSVSPRVNTTIKLSRILRRFTEFLKSKHIKNLDFKHLVFKKIYDNIYFILHKNKTVEHTQVETLYLLISLTELGKEYNLSEEVLCSYFCIETDNQNNLIAKNELNYFSITVLLFYIKSKKRYDKLRKCLMDHIEQRFKEFANDGITKRAELVFLLFDIIVCPYLDIKFRENILNLFNITSHNDIQSIINERKFWFTKWTDFNLGKELDAKQSQEVY